MKTLCNLPCRGDYKASLCPTRPYRGALSGKIGVARGLFSQLVTALQLVNSARVIQLWRAWKCCSQIIPAWCVIFFICNFSVCIIFHKSVSNLINLWSVEEKEVSKCEWENFTKLCYHFEVCIINVLLLFIYYAILFWWF